MKANIIRIDPRDNVAVAIREIGAGENVSGIAGLEVKACSDIPRNHKVALSEIPEGAEVIKYGQAIGLASTPIHVGDWVHVHNIKSSEDA